MPLRSRCGKSRTWVCLDTRRAFSHRSERTFPRTNSSESPLPPIGAMQCSAASPFRCCANSLGVCSVSFDSPRTSGNVPDTQTQPGCTRVYRNHHLDSRRWEHVKFRPDDILISTSYKAGTTWTQRIVSLLLFGPGPLPAPLGFLSPWIDARFFPFPIEQI